MPPSQPLISRRHASQRAICLCLLALFALCSLHAGTALAADKLRLQLRWLHQFQFAGYYMALEKGYYRDAGLDVEILEGGPSALKPVDALLAGDSDFAISNSGMVIERMAGKPVVALAAIMQTSPIVWIVRADSGIRTPMDLAGKRLMLMPAPESAELLITLRREGIDINQLTIQPTSFNLQDLLDGKTDAYDGYISNEPYWLSQHGADYHLINPREYGVNFYNDVLYTREQLVEDKPAQVAAFVAASLKGWQYALAHQEETIRLIQQRYAPGKTLEHLRFEAEALHKLIMPELVQLGHMNPGRWEYIANSYVQLGMAPGPVDLQGFLYTEHVAQDYRMVYLGGVLALLVIVLVGAIALRFATLSRALQREVNRRQTTEQQLLTSNCTLERLANTDRLTGLWNRLKFEEVAHQEVSRAERYGYPLSLVFFDLDHFKDINDQHGHEVGDQVLCRLAQLVGGHLRESDSLCRWGGEEFLILMPHTDRQQAEQLAEKLRERVAKASLLVQQPISASFGIAQLVPGELLRDLVRNADAALYRAKQLGRNRVEA
ncbi:GGDEF domain-containing protein [Aquipseudomonas campi]|uniref:diguanylate cyclase n=1 Tax=Aquipseudomonas campi TaxID=2731681 RepID=A0A6M8FPG0_9GAMM|nr:GGDEF domain-containing protein [Pseudomonas campi]QKE62648.1 GGDEF domain-containing protein [Pseudomonas campi]